MSEPAVPSKAKLAALSVSNWLRENGYKSLPDDEWFHNYHPEENYLLNPFNLYAAPYFENCVLKKWPKVQELEAVKRHLVDGASSSMSANCKKECLEWIHCAQDIKSLMSCLAASVCSEHDDRVLDMWGIGSFDMEKEDDDEDELPNGWDVGNTHLLTMAKQALEKLNRPGYKAVPGRLTKVLKELVETELV